MTYMPVRPYRADVMGPALYGLSGGCGCGGGSSRPAPLAGGCGCGGGSARSPLGEGPLASMLCSETATAKALTTEANEIALVVGLGTGAATGLLASMVKSPALGLLAGCLVGYLVYATQKMPET
jgi:hypothetical protein